MGATSPRTLALAALVALPVGWAWVFVWDAGGRGLPDVSWLTAGLLVFLAAMLLVCARATRLWVRERRFDSRLNPLVVSRFFALAKAASLCGAVVVGAYGGLALALLRFGVEPARLLRPGATVAAGGLLVVAGLALERACRVPTPPDEA